MKLFSLNHAAIRCMIGLLQGGLLCILYAVSQQKTQWPATQPTIFLPMLMVILFVPLLIIQSLGNLRLKTIATSGFLTVLTLISIAYYAIYRQVLPNHGLSELTLINVELFFITSIALFISHAMILSSDQDKQFIAHYSTYFNEAWKLAVQILFTIAFIGIFWLLLFLGSALFNVIHLKFFDYIIYKPYFAIPVSSLAAAIALHITDVNARVTQGIRTLCLVLLSLLLPLIATIICLFLLSLFFTGLTPIWQTGQAGRLLLLSSSILIILINAVYQDGSYRKLFFLQRQAATLSCYLLIPIMALAIYALKLRIQQYGWSVDRIYAAVWIAIGTFYAIGYTLASLTNKTSYRLFEYWNIGTAILILVIYLALHSPLADPVRLSVANQLDRLLSGQVQPEKFDFAQLRHSGLRFGEQTLLDLQNTQQGTKAAYIRNEAEKALKLKPVDFHLNPLTVVEKKQLVIAHTQNGKLPESFLKQDWQSMDSSTPFCLRYRGVECHAWIIQDMQKKSMILLLDKFRFTGFQKNAHGKWQAVAHWDIPFYCKEKIFKEAVEGKFKIVLPLLSHQDIEVMGLRLYFNQNYDENITKETFK